MERLWCEIPRSTARLVGGQKLATLSKALSHVALARCYLYPGWVPPEADGPSGKVGTPRWGAGPRHRVIPPYLGRGSAAPATLYIL